MFTATLFTIVKTWKQPVPINKWRKYYTHTKTYTSIYNEILFRKKNLPFAIAWMGTWWHYTKWNKPDKERQILYNVIYMQNIKKCQIYRNREQKCLPGTGCIHISSIQSLSHVRLLSTPWTAAHQASLSITKSWSLLKLTFIMSMISSNHLILCHPLLLPPSIFPNIRVLSSESALHITWPKYWHFSFSISPSNEYSGLSSFRIDWFDLSAGQRTAKSLLQHHSSKASILWHSTFFIVLLTSIHDCWKNCIFD